MRRSLLAVLAVALACAPSRHETSPVPQPNIDPGARNPPEVTIPPEALAPAPAQNDSIHRVAPPEVAYSRGWMPLAATGVDRFLKAHTDYDGRGVLIGILDTGVDPSVPGLGITSAGLPKVLDVRDFSGEGSVALAPVTPSGDSVSCDTASTARPNAARACRRHM